MAGAGLSRLGCSIFVREGSSARASATEDCIGAAVFGAAVLAEDVERCEAFLESFSPSALRYQQ
jgi:hypothetical protein